MMNNWFSGRVRVGRTQEDGKEKRVTEEYLLDTITFGSAEGMLLKTTEDGHDPEVLSIKYEKYSAVMKGDGEHYYKCTVQMVVYNENKHKEDKELIYLLICANNVDEAKAKLVEWLEGTPVDYVIKGIVQTNIIEVVQYDRKAEAD